LEQFQRRGGRRIDYRTPQGNQTAWLLPQAQGAMPERRTFPFQHLFDNRAGLQELTKNHGRAWIIHGQKDTVLPLSMSETLSREFKDTVKLNVIPDGDHNDIFARGRKELYESMNLARTLPRRDASE
jgi:pimeloyl-ACP methyl ester carboxylesterase